ncbi:MAG: cupin domain-containing protein [Myxococcota bacterium]
MAQDWIQILLSHWNIHVAAVRLLPGAASSTQGNLPSKSDEVLLVLEGEVEAEIGNERARLGAGAVVLVPAGTPHRFINTGKTKAVAFCVYGPSLV